MIIFKITMCNFTEKEQLFDEITSAYSGLLQGKSLQQFPLTPIRS